MKKSIHSTIKATPRERKRYVLKEMGDYLILAKIKILESRRLSKTDRLLVRFLRTQLEHDWRKPLMRFLNVLLKKYTR